jgi:phosphonate transport system ATP-binding protein
VLKDLCLSVPQGKLTMLMGPSGTGKTTLLKVLAGILAPARGMVEVLSRNIADESHRSISSLIGYIPQQLGLVRNLTALENVLMGALGRCGNGPVLFGLFPRVEVEKAQVALDLMGIADKAHEKVFRLSGGQRQRVAIARTLLQHPRVVVADEFVSDLDMALAFEILGRIRRAAEHEQITFIMSMHRQGLAREFADNVVTLKEGKIQHGFPLMMNQEGDRAILVQ